MRERVWRAGLENGEALHLVEVLLLGQTGQIIFVFKEKIRTHLDLLTIPQSGGKTSKRLGGIIG